MDPTQSLVSQRSSDSGLHVQLHPLVLLTISDHITRHAARQQQSPIIGALLGQQNGRQITLEHTFECPVRKGSNDEVLLPGPWFEERVKQFKDVHKDPPLDIVGWWSTAPPSGPNASHLPIHRQLLQDYNESALFLAFHPSQLQEGRGARLPLTIYESVLEGENPADAGKDMQIDGEEPALNIRFRELSYSVETGEAEMIGVDTIAKGSGTATRTETTGQASAEGSSRNLRDEKQVEAGQSELSQEEEELIANLNTRLNAIRALESRISLIKSYVSSISETNAANDDPAAPELSHTILRNINSLLSHLSILSPSEQSAFTSEVLSQGNDVLLVSLLGQMGESVKAMRELGHKSAIIQNARQTGNARKTPGLMHERFTDELYSSGMIPGGGGGSASMYS